MWSQLDQTLPWNMSGRMIRESMEHNLNLVQDPSNEILIRIGKLSESQPNGENLMQSQQMFLFAATANSKESLLIIANLLDLKGKYLCSGESLAQASQEGPGQKPVWMLTQRIHSQSSGMAIEVKNMLLSTNSVVQLELDTYSDGSTDIQFWLKSREARLYLERRRYGSPRISIQDSGTPNWIRRQEMHSSGDWSSLNSPSPAGSLYQFPPLRDFF